MRYLHILLIFVLLGGTAYSQQDSVLWLVSSHEDINLNETRLVTYPLQGPYLLTGNRMLSLKEENDTTAIVLPDSIWVDDMIWTGEEFVVKSGYDIYSLDNIESPLMSFNTNEYDIFPWDKKRIFIVAHEGDTSHLFFGNVKARRAKRLLTMREQLVCVAALDSAKNADAAKIMVVTTKNIYLFTSKGCKRYLSFWTPVHSAVMTHRGLIFATDSEICQLIAEGTFALLFEAQTGQRNPESEETPYISKQHSALFYDYRNLYIKLSNGDLVAFDLDYIEMP